MKAQPLITRATLLATAGCLTLGVVCWLPTAGAQRPPAMDVIEFEAACVQAAQRIAPSVVSIASTRTVTMNPFRDSAPFDFEEFFGEQIPRSFGPRGPREFKSQGLGSGVIVDEQGHILTNHHVVAEADDLRVILRDGESIRATVLGTDPKTDLAVIQIDADDLQPATLAEAGNIRIGNWVLAVGSPFGLDQTVTAGIISASGRAGIGIADYEDLIQTDAAINRGNSGGPLINLRGEVVGINTAIVSRTGNYQGVGFAIPVGMARQVMRSLIDKGEVVRGWLGVWIQPLTPDLAATFNFDRDAGVLIGDVVPGGPADEAGLESGDIILEMEGERVDDASILRNRVAQMEPGTSASFLVWRDGRTRELEVVLKRLPEDPTVVAQQEVDSEAGERLGMVIADLTPDLRERLDLPRGVQGAVVAAVSPLGPAARAGVRVGDVITQIQGETVTSASEVQEILREADLNEGVRVRVRSGEAGRFLLLKKDT